MQCKKKTRRCLQTSGVDGNEDDDYNDDNDGGQDDDVDDDATVTLIETVIYDGTVIKQVPNPNV